MKPTSLTQNQKLEALAYKYYCGPRVWHPKAGDYYTSSRNDLQLYQIVAEDDEHFYTVYCTHPDQRDAWKKEGFTTEGFGTNRVYVPEWILNEIK